MHEVELILALAAGLAIALVLGYLTHRLRLSPIIGYLAAGVVVGPYTPGFVANMALARQLAEVGVILLMFGVGLQFHLDQLLAVRKVVVPGAVAASVATLGMGSLAARLYGWTWAAAILFGLTLAVASTVVLTRVLADRNQMHTSAAHVAIGWLVVEDLMTVLALVLIPDLFNGSPTAWQIAGSIALTAIKVAGLFAFAVIVGQKTIPAILGRVAATRSRELFTLTVLVVALGIAAGAAKVFGVSMALGAFLAGMIVARSEYSVRAATDALPMRDAFAVLFFLSVGMLLDPAALLASPGLALAALAIVTIGKPAVAAMAMLLLKERRRTALTVALLLGQIGEFSFILAGLATGLGGVPAETMNLVVAVSIASIVLNPLVSRLAEPADRLLSRLRRRSSAWAQADAADAGAASALDPHERAVVIGYGPTGRTVARLLRDNGVAPTVIELNIETVHELQQAGMSAVYGDARHPHTLVTAGLRHAETLIISGADPDSAEMIRAAREINSGLHVFARAANLRDAGPLRAAGSEAVFSGEGEVALAMTEAVLRRLGATPDQIDRERRRVRAELFGSSA